jgi:hypothetical protein
LGHRCGKMLAKIAVSNSGPMLVKYWSNTGQMPAAHLGDEEAEDRYNALQLYLAKYSCPGQPPHTLT